MLARSFLAAAALVAMAQAQSTTATPTSTYMLPVATAGFNPNNVTAAVKASWCLAQQNTCPEICGGFTSANSCDQVALTYVCVCLNGTAPDVTRYKNTLPYNICIANYGQCVANNPNNLDGQRLCMQNEGTCGYIDLDASRAASLSTASATASSTSGGSAASSGAGSGSGSSSASTTSSTAAATSSGAAAFVDPQNVANGAFVAVLMAALKLLL